MIRKVFKSCVGDLALIPAVEGGAFLLLETVIAIILLTVKPDTGIAMGSVFLPIIGGFIALISCTANWIIQFDFCLRYGVTRRSALLGLLAFTVTDVLCALGLGYLLGQIDRLIAYAWMDALPWVEELEIDVTLPLWGLGIAALALPLLALGIGAALQRFGRKGFWVVWAAWMLFFLGYDSIDWSFLQNLPWLPVAGGVFLLGAGAWGAWSLLRTSVRQ